MGYPGHAVDRPSPRVYRERRHVDGGRAVLGVAGAARDWPLCATSQRSGSSPTSCARSTSRSGFRVALHPQLDLATEPRWARIAQTFGEDADLAARLGVAYLEGLRGGPAVGPDSVAAMAKHFPGGGPQRDGEDPHFPHGKEQVYPGGMFDYHLRPFRGRDRGRGHPDHARLRRPHRDQVRRGRLRLQRRRHQRAAPNRAGLRRHRLQRLGHHQRPPDHGRAARGQGLGSRAPLPGRADADGASTPAWTSSAGSPGRR